MECANCGKHIEVIIVSNDKDPLVFCSESCLIEEYKLFDGGDDEYLLDKHISGDLFTGYHWRSNNGYIH